MLKGEYVMSIGKQFGNGRTFRPGDSVRTSGVYELLHSTPHAVGEREMYFEGSRFPQCRTCKEGVFYRLESPCVASPSLTREVWQLIAC